MYLFCALSVLALVAADICPSGSTYSSFRGGSCIVSINNSDTWGNALSTCRFINGNLAVPKNAFENTQLSSTIQLFNSLGTWLGAYSDSTGNWMDYNGTALTFNRFVSGQANKPLSCASMTPDGNWYADNCDTVSNYLCQLNQLPIANTTPSTTTTTVRPTTRLPYTTTTPYHVYNYTVQPTYNPSKCPGYDKSTTSTPCPYGWSFYLPTCSCYFQTTNVYTWFEAEQHCVNNKAHLVSIHSQDEAVFVMALNSMTGYSIQIGLQYIGNQWLWSDGTPINFLSWAPRGVNADYSRNACGLIYGRGYYFASYMFNGPCTTRYSHAVCKRPLL